MRNLYLNNPTRNNQVVTIQYKNYYKVLTQVIGEAKHTLQFYNKVRTIWKM